MKYKIYKFDFNGYVHFGSSSLDQTGKTFSADTLFSALFQEAIQEKEGRDKHLLAMAQSGELRISDAFPYSGDTLYLPKPYLYIKSEEKKGDSESKKLYKKLEYIPENRFKRFIQGQLTTDELKNIKDNLDNLGKMEMRTLAAVRGQTETLPYRVEQYSFHEGNGLYIVAACANNEAEELLEELLENLSFAGIGGKRSSGMGKYKMPYAKLPQSYQDKLERTKGKVMTLSGCIPPADKMEEVLEGASYQLRKRSGFVASETFAPEQRRKQDLYVFSAGSCFQKAFEGQIVDVARGGSHPVYRYAMPLFVGVEA